MEEKTTVVIDIQLDDEGVAQRLAQVNEEMQDLKNQNKALRKDVKDGTKTWKEVSVQLAENDAKMKSLKAEQSALSGQVAQATQANRTYGTSLKEQAAQLAELRNRYQSLNEEQRNSEGGQAMLEQIQELDAAMKNSDATLGLFQRNVGDYANSITKALGLTGPAATGASGALKLVGNSAKALIAIPIVAVITGVILVVKKVIDAIKGSETQTMRMREALAVFEPLIAAVKNGFTALANVLIRVVDGAIKVATRALEGLARAADWVGSIFGADWGLTEKVEELKEASAAMVELTRAENEYTIRKRQFSIEQAGMEREVSELRAKVADRERYTAEERMAYLNRAMDLEEQIMQERKRLADENVRLLRERLSLTENDAQANDQLAQAIVAAINVDKEYNETLRNRLKEQQKLDQQIRQESIAAAEAYRKKIEELKQVTEEMIQMMDLLSYHAAGADYLKEQAEKLARFNEFRASLLNDMRQTNQELAALLNELPQLTDLSEALQPTALEQFAAAYKRSADVIEETCSQLESSFGSLASIYKEMAEDESKTEEEREKAARKARNWSRVQVAANTATAMAKGIASAMDKPFPANLGALTSIMAALVSAFAQIKALESHAGGGVVGGRYIGATMGPDTTISRVRPGELILNAEQQRQLFEIANGTVATPNIAAQLLDALAAMPAPVLEYSEFKRFVANVVAYDDMQELK